MHGQTSTAVTELLVIPGVCVYYSQNLMCLIHETKVVDALRLLFHTIKDLNKKIDNGLPTCPLFKCEELSFGEEHLEFYYRDIMECIQAIYGDPQFAHNLVFAPEQHFTSEECMCCIYNEMNTDDWWWKVQVSIL